MDFPKPGPEHQWLERLVGDWTFESDCAMGPGEPSQTSRGRWTIRSLGGFWIIADGEGAGPDGVAHHSVMTVGFDQASGRFVGSFIASMMSKLWLYDGALEGDDRLVLAAHGPNFSGDGEALYHDIIEIPDEATFSMTSRVQGQDGGWTDVMRADYRRAS